MAAKSKKKSGPPRDFEKKTMRVGKIKKGPANVTDTSFTARKVVIRQQNLAPATDHGASSSPVADKIRSLLVNCGHYNVNMRRETLVGLLRIVKETADLHAPDMLAVLDPLFAAIFKLICDDDMAVRTAVAALLLHLFERLRTENLASFFPRWLAFLNLAMSHIKLDIRRDSTRFIQLTLQTQRSLLAPHIAVMLPPMLSLVTQYPVRLGTHAPYDTIVALMDAYLEPHARQSAKSRSALTTPLFAYTWEPVQRRPLRVVRMSPLDARLTVETPPPPMREAVLSPLITHLVNLSITAWLDCAHVLVVDTPHINSPEQKQLTVLLALYRRLFQLCRIAAREDLFWQCLPAKIAKSRLLFQDRLE